MNNRFFPFVFIAFIFISFNSISQSNVRWEKLGMRTVDYKLDRDVIPVGAMQGTFSKLKVTINGGAVNMHKMIVHYKNGTEEVITLKHAFTSGSNSRIIDIRGGRRLIQKITFFYDTKNLSRNKAVINVFGRH
ncbi:MAG: DUF2541 family protein [Crocinitomicaceae bacterium]|nr:DUF2541 family protein [Crocinitomicaceae bacterium]